MAFQVSPGVNISEIDLTTIVPSISTTEGAIGGVFGWGPIGKFLLVDSENTLAARYGKPNNNNYETFFTAGNFLAYGNRLYVSRAATTTGYSNTISTTLNANTTATIASNTAVNGLAGTLEVYGSGVPVGTTATFTSPNATHTTVTLSNAATTSGAASLNFSALGYSFNAVANSSAAPTRVSYLIKNADHFETVSVPSGVEFVARYPGDLGNSLKVSVCDTPDQYTSTIDPYALTGYTNTTVVPGTSGVAINVNEATANVYMANSADLNFATTYTAVQALAAKFTVGDYVEVGNSSIGKQYLKIKSIGDVSNTNPLSPTGEIYFNLVFDEPYKLSTDYTATTIDRAWEFFNVIPTAPATSDAAIAAGSSAIDEISVVVVDEDGKFTGNPGAVLEVYHNLSRATDAKNIDGTTNYYQTVINDNSRYVWSTNDRPGAPSALATAVANSTASTPYTESFGGGKDGATETTLPIADIAAAYDLFADSTTIDVSLIMTGKARGGINGEQLSNYLIDNLAESRRDCVVFGSPEKSDVLGAGVEGNQAENVVNWRNSIRATSYAVLDSGYKYQYDKYNDVYRYVPLNGDIAGITARTDDVRDPWFSPAGFNRGQIKNLVKLAWNPNKADRDILYKNDINPVVTFPGQGTVLFGDKTALGKPSAFDRINVRRLFIILEKTIATAANSTLFEFNDEFTRAQFRNLVEPFLRDVQGRRGIYDFRVVCDETNNTQEVIDTNRFVGDIYVKPAKSINFIQLNFVAVRSGVEFTEVVGRF